tara:strand:+ start:265 stop:519 length:255 start_codon:yes stop_codon:yes gene_type:complete
MSLMSGFETFAYPTLGAMSGAGIGTGMHLASYEDDMPVKIEKKGRFYVAFALAAAVFISNTSPEFSDQDALLPAQLITADHSPD